MGARRAALLRGGMRTQETELLGARKEKRASPAGVTKRVAWATWARATSQLLAASRWARWAAVRVWSRLFGGVASSDG